MLFLNLGKNVLSRYILRPGVSRITNKRLFSKMFLKSLGLLWTVFSDDVKDSLNAFNLLFKEVLDGHAPEERYRTKDLFISDSFLIAVI